MNREFRELTSKFDSGNVAHKILRADWTDDEIDIFVDEKNLKRAIKILKGNYYHKLSFAGTNPGHKIYSIFIDGGQNVTVDFHVTDLSYDGITYMSGSALSASSTAHSISQQQEVIALILHSIYDKGYFKKEYLDYINKAINKNSEEYTAHLTSIPHFVTSKVLNNILRNKQKSFWYTVARLTGLASLSLRQRKPFTIAINKFQKARYTYRNVIIGKSRLVSVIGTDGAGKSTLLMELSKSLMENKIRAKTHYFGWNHFEFPLIRLFYSKVGVNGDKKKVNVQSVKPKTVIGILSKEFVIVLVYGVEMLYRYLLHISFRRLRRRILITDRYVYDIVTFRLHYSGRLFMSLFPRPDTLIYLHGDPVVIAKRKHDETVSSIKKKQNYFENNFSNIPLRAHFVDTTQSLKFCVSHVTALALGYTPPKASK